MARKTISDIAALLNITLEGNLIAPAMLAKVERLEADAQREEDYTVKPGLTIRDEIPRAFRIGQALFSQFSSSDAATAGATLRFVTQLLTDVFGFADLQTGGRRQSDGRDYLVHLEAGDGRIPVIVVPPKDTIDRASEALAFDDRKRSASTALQDWLNAEEDALWGLATNGDVIRLMRDNASLTRPAFVEADLKQIFETEDYSSFSALWLLLHRSRFGDKPAPVTDCALERWRDTGSKEGAVVRDRLRDGVEDALRVLGSGFLEANPDLRKRLSEGDLKLTVFFNELLRIIYRLIFLMVAEDRDLLHDPDASPAMRQLYAEGYSLKRLRERSIRRSNWDKHRDLYEGLKIVFRSLATGQSKLGLPALGGLFDQGLMPDLDKAALPNRALMEAVYRLAWLKEKDALLPINWREMETEELGSVYESLLELTPRIDIVAKRFYFAEGEETKGNQRKTTGSYYTPDSLVQVLLDSALDPVLDRIEREADDPADALTKATVIDPACGSGHFLLAAARRIATRVARIRAGGVASATDFRHALRDVARGCIHGVDRNPMAVELTKVALWIETVEPGKPLGFLDANIRCGDALLGVFDLSVLEKGIPDAAYKKLTGDDKDTAAHYRKKNKQEIKDKDRVQQGFGFSRQSDFTKAFSKVRAMPESSVDQIEAKAKALRALTTSGSDVWQLQQACDLYVAAFLLPKTVSKEFLGAKGLPSAGRETVPTSRPLWDYLRGVTAFGPMIGASVDVARKVHAFHWPLEFPDVMADGGFEVVVGNPPWERIKLQEKEFFASRDTEIASASNKAARTKLIARLKDAAKGTPQNALYHEFQAAKRHSIAASEFVRVDGSDGGRFGFTGVGDVNTYSLFTELSMNLSNSTGRAGMILPLGIATNDTTSDFFSHLLQTGNLVSLISMSQIKSWFAGTKDNQPFCIFTMGVSETTEFAFRLDDTSDLHDGRRRFRLNYDNVSRINPNTKTAPIFRSEKDAELTYKIYDSIPVLIDENDKENGNPWGIKFARLFDMSEDSQFFRTAAQLSDLGFDQDGIAWVRSENNKASDNVDESVFMPLFESKMLHQFDHRFGSYPPGKTADTRALPRPTLLDKQDPEFEVNPRYWVPEQEIDRRLLAKGFDRAWLLGWRDITNVTNERTVIANIFPKFGINDKFLLILSDQTPMLACALLANLNSLTLDFVARQKMAGTSLKYFFLKQFPVLPPNFYSGDHLKFISDRVLKLTYTSNALTRFARDLGFDGPPFGWNVNQRDLLRAELDAFYAYAYGLSRDELRYILDPADVMGEDYPSETFRVLKNKELKDNGEYRTQRLVLEAWDRMQVDGTFDGLGLSTASTAPILQPITLPSIDQLPDQIWAWLQQDERDRIRVQLRAMVGIVAGTADAPRVRLATLACLYPNLLTGFLTDDDRSQWQRLVGPQSISDTGTTRLTPPTNAAWGRVFNELVSAAVLDVSSDGSQWSAGHRLDTSTLHADDPAVGRALFAWSKLQSVDLDQGLTQLSAEILPFIREGRLAA